MHTQKDKCIYTFDYILSSGSGTQHDDYVKFLILKNGFSTENEGKSCIHIHGTLFFKKNKALSGSRSEVKDHPDWARFTATNSLSNWQNTRSTQYITSSGNPANDMERSRSDTTATLRIPQSALFFDL
jgi:hypothetical protein